MFLKIRRVVAWLSYPYCTKEVLVILVAIFQPFDLAHAEHMI